MNVIYFHSGHSDPGIRCLSNFHVCPVVDGDIEFPHLEAAFQAAKVERHEDRLRFKRTTPQGAKKMGGARGKYKMSPERLRRWCDGGERVEVMRRLVHAKFREPLLRRALLGTGDAHLVERLPRFPDSFWGTKKDGSGQNMLGKLLMEERKAIRRSER